MSTWWLRNAQIAGKYYFWVCLWGCLWKRLAVDWVKKIALPNVGGHHPIIWGHEWNKKAEEGQIWSLYLSCNIYLLQLLYVGAQAFGLWLGLNTISPQYLSFWVCTETYTIDSPGFQAFELEPAFLAFQLAGGRLWDFSVSIIVWVSFIINLFIYLYTSYWSCFSKEPWLISGVC